MIFSDAWEEEQKYTAKPVATESSSAPEKKEVDSEDEDEIGPPLPPQMKAALARTDKTESDDEDIIGPPMPPSMQNESKNTNSQDTSKMKGVKSLTKTRDEESDSEEEDDLVNQVRFYRRTCYLFTSR